MCVRAWVRVCVCKREYKWCSVIFFSVDPEAFYESMKNHQSKLWFNTKHRTFNEIAHDRTNKELFASAEDFISACASVPTDQRFRRPHDEPNLDLAYYGCPSWLLPLPFCRFCHSLVHLYLLLLLPSVVYLTGRLNMEIYLTVKCCYKIKRTLIDQQFQVSIFVLILE